MQKTIYVKEEQLLDRAVELGGGMSASAIVEEAVQRWILSKAVAHRLDAVATLALECLEDLQVATPQQIAEQIGATADEVHKALKRHNVQTRRQFAGAIERNFWYSVTYAVNDTGAGTWELVFKSCAEDYEDGDE